MPLSMWPFSASPKSNPPPVATTAPLGAAPTLLASTKDMDRQYRRDLWIARERDRFLTLGFLLLLMVEGLFILIGAFVFLDYYVIRYPEERALVRAFLPDPTFVGAVQTQAPAMEELVQPSAKTRQSENFRKAVLVLASPRM